MNRTLVALSIAAACFASLPFAGSAASADAAPAMSAMPSLPVPDCRSRDLKLTISGANGEFAGMSHDGFNAVVTNVSGGACSIARIPNFSLDSAKLHPSPISPESPPAHMGHGPVMVPVLLEPKASAYSTLRWVSSDAFAANNCATATRLVSSFAKGLALAGTHPAALVTSVHVHACGAAPPAQIMFSATHWQPGRPPAQ